ncbi:MAG: hypothetical protein KIT86_00585 [Hydrogenophaga sp.]|jgi:hypothetical protein|uniref:hypothetical protein n=1 Tax=Hydrogenophaga sp. TaxID=1904254 RepID=UPI0026099836|nr:hypothetical protein [Hydrogenophaga sp.]MCW5668122.1 hypothetical protein [Hydrogenophaga sp.]
MNKLWRSFTEGFVGSFVLAGAIVMSIVSVASAFVNGSLEQERHNHDGKTQT